MAEIPPESIERGLDAEGEVAALVHPAAPFEAGTEAAEQAVREYLTQLGPELGIEPHQLRSLDAAPEEEPVDARVEYRFEEAKTQFDTTTYAYQQTMHGLPVWGAGVGVHVKGDPTRVVGAQATLHRDVEVAPPTAAAAPDAAELARLVGLDADARVGEIRSSRLVVYRYEANRRLDADDPLAETARPSAVDPSIREGAHYVAHEVVFTVAAPERRDAAWLAIVDAETGAVLRLRPFVESVSGLVFARDPISATGSAAHGPNSPASELNPLRKSVTLQNLVPPAGGAQHLEGSYVKVVNFEPPSIAPPIELAGSAFAYGVRTNEFAAVNAYHHCDYFFRMVESLGFPMASYFDGTTFPVPIDHRGRYGSTNGVEINASCAGTGTGGIDSVDFELADLGDLAHPIGIALDRRIALHELGGHGILYDHVNSPNFGFAHSAGDSIAAILGDPETHAPHRFETFPWLAFADRRHDRKPAAGWGWGGTEDDGGYGSEQILCTTHFRIYRALGGDSPDLALRTFAARFTVYLILRAVGTLTPATNPTHASGFAAALLAADAGDWTTAGHAGGAYGKVIRWAFEKQGLYRGKPPAVDLYVDDGRHGEYGFQPDHWSNPSVWNRHRPDGGSTHQEPAAGKKNHAYVRVRNRGATAAKNAVVRGYHAKPTMGLRWPGDWKPMTTAKRTVASVPANATKAVAVGPFEWTPGQLGHECMLMVVSSAADPSNVSKLGPGESFPEWRLVPHDNNIGQRNLHPVPAHTPAALRAAMRKRRMVVRNPQRRAGDAAVSVALPKLLHTKGWAHDVDPAAKFALQPGTAKEIEVRLTPGKPFTAAELKTLKPAERTIRIVTRIDDIVVGGMGFVLDPARAN